MHILACVRIIQRLQHNSIYQLKISIEDFGALHKVVIYGVSDNMASIVQLGQYGAIKTVDPTTMVYYIIKYLYET